MLSATNGDQNPFENILLSIAASSDMVLQAVLALSGMHLSGEKSTELVVATHEHYALALRGLKYGLTKFVNGKTELALELTVTTLLFCFLEVWKPSILPVNAISALINRNSAYAATRTGTHFVISRQPAS